MPINENLALVLGSMLAKKGEDATVLDLSQLGSITDYFVICHGRGPRQVQTISDKVAETLKAAGRRPAHLEGYANGEWILMDYIDFVVHIFTKDRREFYDLEKLWSDAPRLDLAPAPPPAGSPDVDEGPPNRETFFDKRVTPD